MPRLGVTWISRLAICILMALGVTQTAPVEVNAAGESWFNDSWHFRKAITIDATKVSSGPHTDFPVLVNLTSDSSLAANAQADGDDILFTSSGGATQLKHEIEKYGSSTGALVAWVKIPSLPSSTDTVFFMYYGNGSATSQQDATNVWDSNYKGVWHLQQSGDSAGNDYLDSTSNANHGQGGGGTAANVPTLATAKISAGQDFDGTNDFIQITDAASLDNAGAGTIEAWIRRDVSGAWHSIAAKGNTSTDAAHNYTFEIEDAASGNQLNGGLGNSGTG